MFREFIRWALGPLGREVLQFYEEYNVIINVIVLLYGVVLFYPHYTLVNVVNRIERMIQEISKALGPQLKIDLLHKTLVNEWNDKYQEKVFILPTKNDLWFERHSGEGIIELLEIDQDYLKMALHKITGKPSMKSFRAIDFKIWEKYRRQLKKGIRSNTPSEIAKMRKESNVK